MLKKLSDKNQVVVACAGSGKTTYIVEESLKLKKENILVTTYTNENLDQFRMFFVEKAGCIPTNITVQSWFTFLLQEGVRPYQNHFTDNGRVKSIYFFRAEDTKFKEDLKYVPETNRSHYLTGSDYLYEDKVAKFICKCNIKSNGLVIKRLEKIYNYIFIDELQDLAGYDLDLFEMLFKSSIRVISVGDPRQATFSTNTSQRNKQYKRSNIFSWLKTKVGLIRFDEKNDCYRCNQSICDFGNKLFPDLPKAISKNTSVTKHDGIFFIRNSEVHDYIKIHRPKVLRYSKMTDTLGYSAINIGRAKGRTFDRVLIFPTKPMRDYLKTNDLSRAGDKSKLYIAVTRAKYSVAFVMDDKR